MGGILLIKPFKDKVILCVLQLILSIILEYQS